MVKVAIAGASGNVAQELLDVLVTTRKQEVVLMSRKDIPGSQRFAAATWVTVNYEDRNQLAQKLQGVNTLLCFIPPQSDPGNIAQKNLIDAAVKAGVKRYAPSEWASSSLEYMPWYAGKAEIRHYLEYLNKDKKVLEYCLFQAGMFVNYFAGPHQTTRHIHPFQNQFDLNSRRAIVLETTWLPKPDPPAIPAEQVEKLAASMVAGMLLAISAGAMRVSDDWNRLFPDYEFTRAEAFLTEAWRGKP